MKNPLHTLNKYLASLLVLIVFLSYNTRIEASHIPGANITYTCNPANPLEYTFTLTMFRKCPGTLGTTIAASYLTLSNTCGLSVPSIPTFTQVGTAVDVNQLCNGTASNCNGGSQPSVWMYTYEGTITLPANCDSWNLAFALCCRDASSNLSNGSNNTMACSTTLNTITAPCNNSPVVTSPPIPYACTNTPFSYCLTTADPEGDSTYFRMVSPRTVGQAAIAHLGGYSITSPLQNFVLDPLTGCFTFNQATTGNYVVAIQIEEYDNAGNLKSVIIHDFQILVINCNNTPPNNPVGGITNVSGSGSQTGTNGIAACLGQSFCFDVTFADTVDLGDTVIILTDGTTLFPGATFTQTGTNPVTGTFCWTATTGSTGTIATFTAEDNGCPVKGITAFGVNIDIISGVFAGPDQSVCGGNPAQLTATGGTVFNWSPATGLSCTNCPNPTANPAVTTVYTVTGNLSGSCSNSDQVTVNVENTPPTATITGNAGICNTGSNTLTATGGSRFLWSTGATTSSITVSPTSTMDYSVIVTNFVGGCEAYDTATVTVGAAPVSNLRDKTICNGNSADIRATGGGLYLWSTGATTATLTVTPLVTTDYQLTITLGSCSVLDTVTINVTSSSAPVMNCRRDTTLSACDNPVVTFLPPVALDYCASSPCVSSPLGDVLSSFSTNGASIASNIPGGYNFSNGMTGTNINDGGNDMYDGGNYLDTDISSSISYTNGAIVTSGAFGAGANNYFTHKFSNLWLMAADLNGVSSFSTRGNNGADGQGIANGFTYTLTVGCMDYYIFVKRIFGAGNDPSINHVYIVPDNGTAPAPTQSFATNTNDDRHTVSGLTGFDRLYYLLFAGTSGRAYTDAEVRAVVLDFLTQTNVVGGGVARAAVVQTTGLASGSTFPTGTTTITYQATGIGGVSTCSFDIIILPNNAPTVSCRADTTVSICNSVVNFSPPVGIDVCNACANSTLGDVLSSFSTNGASIASNIPGGYNFSNGTTGTNINDGGNDMYDGGNYLDTDISSSISYTNGAIATSGAFGAGANNYFTHKFSNLWLMAADLNGVSSFSTRGNNGADGQGTANGFTYTLTVGCMDYYIFVKRIFGAGNDPSINHVYIVPDNGTTPAPTQSFATNTNDDRHTVSGLTGFDRLYYLLFAGTSGRAYTDAEVRAVVLDFLTQTNVTSGVSSTVTVTQIAGLASGSTFPLGTNTVTFQATSSVSGLSSTCSFDIIVLPRPTATITGNAMACSGASTTLTATGGVSYLWNTGGTTPTPTVTPVSNTTYTVTVTDNFNCTNTASHSIAMQTPSTAPSIAPIPSTICPNTTVSLTAAGGVAGAGATMKWYTSPNGGGTYIGSGSTLNTVPTSTSTTYYARREGACNNTADATVVVNLKDYVYALNATTTNTWCTDNSGWHHFFNGNEIYLSVQGDLTGAPAGFPQVTINDNGSVYQQTQGPFYPSSCASGWTPGEERFEMERSWNLNFGGGTLNPPYNVRFYYEMSERTALETAASNHLISNTPCGYSYKYNLPNGLYWFKNVGSNYTAPDYDGLHLMATSGTTPNGTNYTQMTGVTSFSGGSAGIILVPLAILPVDWLYFDGTTNNKINFLRWATEQEQNTAHFNIQRSANGVDFATIATVAAQGVSTTVSNYTYDDVTPLVGDNYYRLELIDIDGKVTYSSTILLSILDNGLGYTFYPNPTTDIINYQYESSSKEALKIEVIDVYGRVLFSNKITSEVGLNQIPISLKDYLVGTYVVKVYHLATGNVHTTKVIRSK